MEIPWTACKAWVAHFDILGFKDYIDKDSNTVTINILKASIDESIEKIKSEVSYHKNAIDFLFYADTIILYSDSMDCQGYPSLVRVAKNFLISCVQKRLPTRGAISYGELIFGHEKRIVMGKAFLESHVYGEDQNWIGLILTPSASCKLKAIGLDPVRHGFINRDIPLRRFSIYDDSIYAYRFINGSTNYKCHLLPILDEMMRKASSQDQIKYINTIKFIERYYTVQAS